MTTTQLTPGTRKEVLLNSSSVQVKMFMHSHPRDAERAIQQWLEENQVSIHHIAQSQSEKSGSFVFVITLFYVQNN
jgi:hypothetical protein